MKKISQAMRHALRTTAALALLAGGSASYAQATSEPPPAEPTKAEEEERPIEPLAGRIRSFAGDVTGTAGRIRSFEGGAVGSAGRIRSFAGEVASFAGRIRSFQGEVLPTSGVNTAFWGSLQAVSGTVIPEAGRIRSFSGELEGTAGRIRSFTGDIRAADGSLLSYDQATAAYNNIAAQIAALVKLSEGTFGAAVEAESGKSFEEAFAQRLLAKYGIDLDDPSSLAGLNEVDIELFLLDWNDNLMNYSGRDQVDHWMKTVNWTPSLTQQVSGGIGAKIGLLDFTIKGAETKNIIKADGISEVAGGHGDAVASLLVAAHDGKGIMGIAPSASIVAYNPFDETYTAGWDDIKTGIQLFIDAKVSVVNMSLGVPGWTLNDGWNDVFADGKLDKAAQSQLFVLAAGNDGVMQPSDIEWRADKNPDIIVVGSVDPSGKISAFSNTPGTTCLLKDGKCGGASDLLMNRFIVAPGEFILVSDGNGGVTRLSGTSFAAPLVSGTATLIADRWPWLSTRPKDIANIILGSAKDLGEPGVDAVYGHGLLDVSAALAPKSFDSLSWKVSVDGKITTYKGATIAPVAISSKATWETKGGYVTVFDDTDTSFRDFTIPLSSKLLGQTVGTTGEQFQAYLTSRFWAWIANQPTAPTSKTGFVDDQLSSPIFGFGNLRAAMTLRPKTYRPGIRQSTSPFESAISLATADNRVGLQLGSGNGAVALGGNSAFGLNSDYDIYSGGVNPFLSLASGAGYASVKFAFNDRLTVSTGISGQHTERDLRGAPTDVFTTLSRVQPYQASANTVSVGYSPSNWLETTATFTMLREKTGLLGVQSLDENDFGGGSITDAATYGMDVAVTPSLSVGASATIGRTRSGNAARQSITVSKSGLISSAFQLGVTKTRLFDKKDSARLTVSQPMYIESGSIDFDSVQVVDRQTGELGVVTQKIGLLSGKRSFVTEAIYRRPVFDGKAELNLFGRARIGGSDTARQDAALTLGASFRAAF